MKKTSVLTIGVLTSILTFLSCKKDQDPAIEMYNQYLTVQINSVNRNSRDSIYQIQVINSKDKVFEKECELIFTLTNDSDSIIIQSEEIVVNKRIPNDPSRGCLNIQNGGVFTQIVNLNELHWSIDKVDSIEKGVYNLTVNLFINDPSSPTNNLASNRILYQKD